MPHVPDQADQPLADLVRGADLAALSARYNIAPSEQVLAVRRRPEPPGYELVALRWGLPLTGGRRLPFARVEMAHRRAAFREALLRRRCLVLADGFYQWRAEGGRRRPYQFRLRGGRPFYFAALWGPAAVRGGQGEEGCAVLTVPANELVRPFHARMPAILGPEDYPEWLGSDAAEPATLRRLLRPYPAEAMGVRPASAFANDPGHEGPPAGGPRRGPKGAPRRARVRGTGSRPRRRPAGRAGPAARPAPAPHAGARASPPPPVRPVRAVGVISGSRR
jgi:putative SOS response-associated peptidase YedK